MWRCIHFRGYRGRKRKRKRRESSALVKAIWWKSTRWVERTRRAFRVVFRKGKFQDKSLCSGCSADINIYAVVLSVHSFRAYFSIMGIYLRGRVDLCVILLIHVWPTVGPHWISPKEERGRARSNEDGGIRIRIKNCSIVHLSLVCNNPLIFF